MFYNDKTHFFSLRRQYDLLYYYFSSDILEIWDLLDIRRIKVEEGDINFACFFFIADHLTFSGYLVMSNIFSIETYFY